MTGDGRPEIDNPIVGADFHVRPGQAQLDTLIGHRECYAKTYPYG